MKAYSKIPYPVKILYIGKDKIFYKTSNNSIRIFLPKKLNQNNPYYDEILQYLNKASIQGSAFCWNINGDEICIGKDTIHKNSKSIFHIRYNHNNLYEKNCGKILVENSNKIKILNNNNDIRFFYESVYIFDITEEYFIFKNNYDIYNNIYIYYNCNVFKLNGILIDFKFINDILFIIVKNEDEYILYKINSNNDVIEINRAEWILFLSDGYLVKNNDYLIKNNGIIKIYDWNNNQVSKKKFDKEIKNIEVVFSGIVNNIFVYFTKDFSEYEIIRFIYDKDVANVINNIGINLKNVIILEKFIDKMLVISKKDNDNISFKIYNLEAQEIFSEYQSNTFYKFFENYLILDSGIYDINSNKFYPVEINSFKYLYYKDSYFYVSDDFSMIKFNLNNDWYGKYIGRLFMNKPIIVNDELYFITLIHNSLDWSEVGLNTSNYKFILLNKDFEIIYEEDNVYNVYENDMNKYIRINIDK